MIFKPQNTAVMSEKTKEKKTETFIKKAVAAAAAAGILSPLPGGADIPALIGIWVIMLKGIADIYNQKFDKKALGILLKDALMASGIMIAGIRTLTFLLTITGIGIFAAIGINAFLNAIVTWRVGRLFRDSWRQGKQVTFKDILNELKKAIEKKELKHVWRIIRLVAIGKS